MDALQRIARLLRAEDAHKRIAAAVVLGELKPKDKTIVSALIEMAQEPLEPFANAAIGALGEIGAVQALPVLVASLSRSAQTRELAARALSGLGPAALPALKARLLDASPDVRALISQVLPRIGGAASFQLTLDGLRGQPWEAANKVALSVRHEVKAAAPAERRAMRTRLETFLAAKATQADEPALKAGLKLLGYLELPEAAPTLLAYLSRTWPLGVRIEALTALRFALFAAPGAKAISALLALLDDPEALIQRAARDTLRTLRFDAAEAPLLAKLAAHRDAEMAAFAIERLAALGGKVVETALVPLASGADRARAQAAAKALSTLEGGERLLFQALLKAKEEAGAHVLAEALLPTAGKLSKKDVARLLEAGAAALTQSVALGRRKLEPLREVAPQGWAEAYRAGAKAAGKKDPARRQALLEQLCRTPLATAEDRLAFALGELARAPLDLRTRAGHPALAALEPLVGGGFPLGKALAKDKTVDDAALYALGFHFTERPEGEAVALGVELLEALAGRAGRTKLGKAAKNKLALVARREG